MYSGKAFMTLPGIAAKMAGKARDCAAEGFSAGAALDIG
jgi:hypothetical protein